jgi:hypothetical protein
MAAPMPEVDSIAQPATPIVPDTAAPLAGESTATDGTSGAVKLINAAFETVPKVAVTVADWEVAIVPAVIVKLTDVLDAGTVTEDGVVSSALLSDKVTAAAADTAALRATVQVL